MLQIWMSFANTVQHLDSKENTRITTKIENPSLPNLQEFPVHLRRFSDSDVPEQSNLKLQLDIFIRFVWIKYHDSNRTRSFLLFDYKANIKYIINTFPHCSLTVNYMYNVKLDFVWTTLYYRGSWSTVKSQWK